MYSCNVLKNGTLYGALLHNFLIFYIIHTEHMGKKAAVTKLLANKNLTFSKFWQVAFVYDYIIL